MSFGEVALLPGMGHDRHNHPGSEEILYVLSGEGLQMVGDEDPFPVRAGDTIYVPLGVFHSTMNTGWAPLRLLAIYNPGGPEKDLEGLPDFQEVAAGKAPAGPVPPSERHVGGCELPVDPGPPLGRAMRADTLRFAPHP